VQSDALTPGDGGDVRESAVWFGDRQSLFGIVSKPGPDSATDLPAVVLLCGGAVHRVSANRMYVPLARRLASIGFTVLRMDVSGIGDSPCAAGETESNPYAQTLCDDVEAAMQMLSEQFGAQRFILNGLCSGAYAALETAKSSNKVAGLVLINQLVYFLSPQGASETNSRVNGVSGAEDFPKANTFADRVARKVLHKISTKIAWPSNLLMQRSLGGDLSAVLLDVTERRIPIDFVFSAKDPAQNALMLFSGKMVKELVQKDMVTLSTIADTDHTFSPAISQDDVLRCIVESIETRWCR